MNKLFKFFQCIKYRNVILGKIGKNNHFDKHTRIESTARIGDYNYFSFRVMIGNAIIGNYCSIGPDAKIGQSQHSIDYYTTSQIISKKNIGFTMIKNSTIVGNDVWIGANAVVMQGVKIGNGAVVGANAVVTKDIPDYSIAVGVPAKVIRLRLSNEDIEKIKKTEWWKYDVKTACGILKKIEKDENQ